MDNLLEQLEQWNKNDEFSRCIEAIEAIPEKERGYKLTVLLGRAYSNLAVLGDHKAHGDDDEVDKELIQHSIDILETVWKQGENDPYWNARMGYAHLMADDTAAVALEYGKRWLELEPDNPEAQKLVSDCEGYLSEEPVEMYGEADWDAVEKHIEKYFGYYDYVFHESVSTGIHLDICVIPPRKDHNYYTLVTFGMGAHRMNVPEELTEKKLERAELLINLPPDWKLSEEDWQEEKWYWPIDVLKWIARIPVKDRNTWLGWGHTISSGEPFAESTKLCGAMLLNPGVFGEPSYFCTLPDGDEVNFYQLIPLYKEEMEFKLENSVDETYYNWLMGYGIDDNNIPEIVLIPVDPKWDWIDEPIYCKKTNSEMTQDKKTSLFILKNDQLEDSKIDLQLISSVAMMENYLMDVNYMFDYEKLSEYCMKYWMGK